MSTIERPFASETSPSPLLGRRGRTSRSPPLPRGGWEGSVDFAGSQTASDSARKRLPVHAPHNSSLNNSAVPRPWQSGQAPYGELNENKRGSISGNENPSSGQLNLAESICSNPS